MGRRTSLYLSDDLEAAVRASGLPLAELVRRGLAGPGPAPPAQQQAPGENPAKTSTSREAATPRNPIRAERPPSSRADNCPHPAGRRLKGLCMACGTRPA